MACDDWRFEASPSSWKTVNRAFRFGAESKISCFFYLHSTAAWQSGIDNEVRVLLNIRSKLRCTKLAIDACGWQQGRVEKRGFGSSVRVSNERGPSRVSNRHKFNSFFPELTTMTDGYLQRVRLDWQVCFSCMANHTVDSKSRSKEGAAPNQNVLGIGNLACPA